MSQHRARIIHSPSTRRGFTLVEIMIVVAILGIILAIAGPTWIRQREISQQASCRENLSKIEGAKHQWALENNIGEGSTPAWNDLVEAGGTGYIKKMPECPASGTYTINPIAVEPTCSINAPRDHNLP